MSGIVAQNLGRHTGLVKASSAGGVWNLIKTYTASGDADLSFVGGTDGVDFTAYDEFVFKFNDVHPAVTQKRITFQVDTGTNTSYNQTITSTTFQAYYNEGDVNATLEYVTGYDQGQGTAFQVISEATGNANDECVSGYLHLFDPSNTTFVKHFIARTQAGEGSGYSSEQYTAGYINTTTALTRVQFKMSDGDIDAGDICLYGIN